MPNFLDLPVELQRLVISMLPQVEDLISLAEIPCLRPLISSLVLFIDLQPEKCHTPITRLADSIVHVVPNEINNMYRFIVFRALVSEKIMGGAEAPFKKFVQWPGLPSTGVALILEKYNGYFFSSVYDKIFGAPYELYTEGYNTLLLKTVQGCHVADSYCKEVYINTLDCSLPARIVATAATKLDIKSTLNFDMGFSDLFEMPNLECIRLSIECDSLSKLKKLPVNVRDLRLTLKGTPSSHVRIDSGLNIEHLQIRASQCNGVFDFEFLGIPETTRSLNILGISPRVIESAAKLETLMIKASRVPTCTFPNLKTLCFLSTSEDAIKLYIDAPNLRSLRIQNRSKIDLTANSTLLEHFVLDENDRSFSGGFLLQVKRLVLSNSYLDSSMYQQLAGVQNLILRDCSLERIALDKLSNLKTLTLERCNLQEDLNDIDLNTYWKVSWSNHPTLESLHLSMTKDAKFVRRIFEVFPIVNNLQIDILSSFDCSCWLSDLGPVKFPVVSDCLTIICPIEIKWWEILSQLFEKSSIRTLDISLCKYISDEIAHLFPKSLNNVIVDEDSACDYSLYLNHPTINIVPRRCALEKLTLQRLQKNFDKYPGSNHHLVQGITQFDTVV